MSGFCTEACCGGPRLGGSVPFLDFDSWVEANREMLRGFCESEAHARAMYEVERSAFEDG
jgi:hypothetical protein